jgi:hypothetical protein
MRHGYIESYTLARSRKLLVHTSVLDPKRVLVDFNVERLIKEKMLSVFVNDLRFRQSASVFQQLKACTVKIGCDCQNQIYPRRLLCRLRNRLASKFGH